MFFCFRPVQGGVDSKNLFHNYIMVWIQDMQLNLLELCKAEKVLLTLPSLSPFLPLPSFLSPLFTNPPFKAQTCTIVESVINFFIFITYYLLQVPWSGVTTNHSTSPFAEEMYEKIKDTLVEYEVVINRWPHYSLVWENVRSKLLKTVTIVDSLFVCTHLHVPLLCKYVHTYNHRHACISIPTSICRSKNI